MIGDPYERVKIVIFSRENVDKNCCGIRLAIGILDKTRKVNQLQRNY